MGVDSPCFSGWLCSTAGWTTRPSCKMVWTSRPHLWPGSWSQVIYFVQDNMYTWHFFSFFIPLPNVYCMKLKKKTALNGNIEERIKHGIKPTEVIHICTSIRSSKYAVSFFSTACISCFKEKASTYIFYMLMLNFTSLNLRN